MTDPRRRFVSVPSSGPSCPDCGASMSLMEVAPGVRYWGCSMFRTSTHCRCIVWPNGRVAYSKPTGKRVVKLGGYSIPLAADFRADPTPTLAGGPHPPTPAALRTPAIVAWCECCYSGIAEGSHAPMPYCSDSCANRASLRALAASLGFIVRAVAEGVRRAAAAAAADLAAAREACAKLGAGLGVALAALAASRVEFKVGAGLAMVRPAGASRWLTLPPSTGCADLDRAVRLVGATKRDQALYIPTPGGVAAAIAKVGEGDKTVNRFALLEWD